MRGGGAEVALQVGEKDGALRGRGGVETRTDKGLHSRLPAELSGGTGEDNMNLTIYIYLTIYSSAQRGTGGGAGLPGGGCARPSLA